MMILEDVCPTCAGARVLPPRHGYSERDCPECGRSGIIDLAERAFVVLDPDAWRRARVRRFEREARLLGLGADASRAWAEEMAEHGSRARALQAAAEAIET